MDKSMKIHSPLELDELASAWRLNSRHLGVGGMRHHIVAMLYLADLLSLSFPM